MEVEKSLLKPLQATGRLSESSLAFRDPRYPPRYQQLLTEPTRSLMLATWAERRRGSWWSRGR